MRKKCLDMVHDLAKRDERVYFIGSDLGFRVLDAFRREIPARFIMEGVSEANIIGLAAGLAMDGKIPYVNTIATFLTRRAFEQIVVDVCLHNLPVRLIGNGGGLVYAPLGSTHMAFEDISALRVIPNMTIVAPADSLEMERLMPLTLEHPGPIYIRLGKGHDPIVTSRDTPFRIGRAVTFATGREVLVIASGVTLARALEARAKLAELGIDAGLLHLHTLKPLDSTAILEAAANVRAVITVEENVLIGGLGEAVATLLMDNGLGYKRLARIGIPDVFPDFYGSQNELLDKFGISASGIVETARKLVREAGPC